MSLDVLIIEDENALLELVRVNLSLRGISIVTASSGVVGLKYAFDLKPRVILLDIRLPDIDGWEICRRLRESSDHYTPKIVFLTAATQQRDKQRAKDAGGDEFLEKPFEISALLSVVRQFLE